MKYLCILLLLVLSSCINNSTKIKGVCRHEAVYCALILKDTFPTANIQICSGQFKNSKQKHAQTRIFINGNWIWYHSINNTLSPVALYDFNIQYCINPESYIKYTFFYED